MDAKAQRTALFGVVRDGLADNAKRGRGPARGAWVGQLLHRHDPSFDYRVLGFPNLAAYLRELGFVVDHDGVDITVSSPSSAEPREEDRHRASPAASATPGLKGAPSVWIDREVWWALTRPAAVHCYLDADALVRGEVRLSSGGALPGPRELPLPCFDTKTQIAWLADWCDTDAAVSNPTELRQVAKDEGLGAVSQRLRTLGADGRWRAARNSRLIEGLREWMSEHGLPWGPPLVRNARTAPYEPDVFARPHVVAQSRDSTLVQLAIDVVNNLSARELRRLRVPLGAVADALAGFEDDQRAGTRK